MLIDPLWSVSNLNKTNAINYSAGHIDHSYDNSRFEHFLDFVRIQIDASVDEAGAEFLQRQLFVAIVVHASEHSKENKVNPNGTFSEGGFREHEVLQFTCRFQKCQTHRGPNRADAVSPPDSSVCHRRGRAGFCSSAPTHRAISNWSDVVTSAHFFSGGGGGGRGQHNISICIITSTKIAPWVCTASQ